MCLGNSSHIFLLAPSLNPFSMWAVATTAELYDVIHLGPVLGETLLPVVKGLSGHLEDVRLKSLLAR